MKYISTRGQAPELDFAAVLLEGLARDGGLYVPKTWPALTADEIAALAGRPYPEIAAKVLAPFTADAFPEPELKAIAEVAYRSFGNPAVTPLSQIGPDTFVLELFHGPTLAFKDLAMQVLARLMDRALARRGERAMIVGATSGDTGGAAIEAFRGARHADVVILYPRGRVSDVQRRMMTTPTEANVTTLEVEGTFDDCQALVKALFNDQAFRDRVRLTGVNSINFARVAIQIVYYFAAATALGGPFRPVSFVVPTGNFGDILAADAARRMGLPMGRLVIATNANDILARTRSSGRYEMKGVTATMSPSMDIEISSNFERYLFEALGRNPAEVRARMDSLRQARAFDLGPDAAARFRRDFDAAMASEPEVEAAIRRIKSESGLLIDPHTACAAVALDKVKSPGQRGPWVLLATAAPAKFPDAMASIAGVRPPLPARLSDLMSAPERTHPIANDAAAIKAAVLKQADAASRRGEPR